MWVPTTQIGTSYCWISNRNHSVPTNRWRWPSEPLFSKDPQRSVSLSSLWIATLSRPSGLVVLFFSRSFLPFTSCSSFSLSSTRIRYFCFPSLCEMYFVFFHVLWDVFPTNTFILKSWLTCILVIWQLLPFVTFAYNTSRQETTGRTPFYLLYGWEAVLPIDALLGIQTIEPPSETDS